MKDCAYCGNHTRSLTREHLFPASLHARIAKSNEEIFGDKQTFYMARVEGFVKGEPTLRDVCAACNNGPLSMLDAYICELWDCYFNRIVESGEEILFSYDPDKLSRWLLKMCYNSARLHKSDVGNLAPFRHYMLNGGTVPESIRIHLQLVSPAPLTFEEQRNALAKGYVIDRYEPRMNRVGHVGYRTQRGYGRLIRAVYLQSYLFLIHLFPEKVTEDVRRLDLEDFDVQYPYATLIGEIGTSQVACRGLNARETFYEYPPNHNRDVG